MKRFISIFAMLFLFVGMANAQTASHTVGVEVEKWSTISISGSPSIIFTAATMQAATTQFVSQNSAPVTLSWATNTPETDKMKITMAAANSTLPSFYGDGDELYLESDLTGYNIVPDSYVLGNAGVIDTDGGLYLQEVRDTNPNNIIEDIWQGGGSVDFVYKATVQKFSRVMNESIDVKYTLTAQ